MDKDQEIEALDESAAQGEGYLEAAKSGFREIGDEEGEAKADEALGRIAEVREHIRRSREG
jgi:hypothetical protein